MRSTEENKDRCALHYGPQKIIGDGTRRTVARERRKAPHVLERQSWGEKSKHDEGFASVRRPLHQTRHRDP